MSRCRHHIMKSLRFCGILLSVSGVNAQTCLVLSPPVIATNGTVSLNLSLYSSPGKAPAAVQWTFQFASSGVKNLTVDDGPGLISAGKTAMCFGDAAAYNCMAAGMNAKTIANGIIAKLSAEIAPGSATAIILIKSAIGASSEGYVIPVISKVLPSAGIDPPPACRSRSQRRDPDDISRGRP
jgi:hypothetical protein